MFKVEMLPASLGDSLWVEYGDPARPNRFLIDGGLVGTLDIIEQRIREVAEGEGGRCRLELLDPFFDFLHVSLRTSQDDYAQLGFKLNVDVIAQP